MSYFDIYKEFENEANNEVENQDTKHEQLLVLHGVFGSKSNWHTTAKRLSKKYEVFVPDLPNHGISPIRTDAPLNYEFLANHIIAFIEKYMNAPINLMGHSMGGKTAMLVSFLAPHLIKKLVVVDMTPKTYDHSFNANLFNSYTELGTNMISTRSREETKEILLKHNDRETVAFLLKGYKKRDDGTFTWQFNVPSIYEGFKLFTNKCPIDYAEQKSKIPLLVVKGEKSNYITLPDDEKYFAKFYENYQIKTVLNTGHNPHVEDITTFNDMVFDFI